MGMPSSIFGGRYMNIFNKETGLIWEIDHPELIRRLEHDQRYEVVRASNPQQSIAVEKAHEIKKPEPKPQRKRS